MRLIIKEAAIGTDNMSHEFYGITAAGIISNTPGDPKLDKQKKKDGWINREKIEFLFSIATRAM